MASQQGSFYDHASRSGPSSSSMPLSNDSPLLDSALRSSREAALSTKLPSALGIGPSTSRAPSTSNAATTNASSLGWTVTGNGSGAAQGASQPRNDSQWIRSTVATSSSSLSPDLTGATSLAPVAGGEGSTTGGQKFHPSMQSVPQGSLDRMTTTGSSMQSSSGANGSTRNFLVPIGATGARQKLSILSAAQRPVTSASATASSLHQGSDMVSQRSLNQLDSWSGRRRPMTSGEGSRATSLGTDRRLLQDRVTAATGDHNRSFSTGRYDHLSPSTFQAKPENGDALAHRRVPQQDRPSKFRAASWQTASHSGNESSSIPQRQGSTIGGANQAFPQLGSNGRAGEEGSNGDPSSSTQPLMLIDGRNGDAGLQRQALRPSSSAGRERAAKIGAGFKNMFASRSGKEGSPKGVHDGGGSPLSNRNLQLQPHQLPNSSSQPDMKGETEATDPDSAQSVGWTASSDGESAREQREQAEPELPLQRRKPSLLSRRTEATAVGDRSPLSRMSDTPPSIDLELPTMGGLFGSFASDQLFPYNTTPDEGTGSRGARNAKGVPTTGLNLEVAGQTFPSSQYSAVVEREEDNETPSQDKSLPPTPVIEDWKRSSNTSGPQERPTQGWARAAEESGFGKGSTSILPTSGPLSSPLFDRIASLALASESSRRGSATTATTSDGHDASLETPSRSNHSARSTSDNRTSSPGESTYSAPNSSRTWSPVTSDKPSVPMTSPLLASLMSQNVQSQQQQQQHGSIAEHSGLQQRRIASPLTTSSFSAADSSVTSSQPAFTSTLPSPSPRPDLPAKSRDRQSMGPQPDAATLAKLENGQNSQRADHTPSKAHETIRLTAGTKEETAASQSTYVPPGALTYTRKGTAVRPTASKIDPVAIVGERDVHSSASLQPVLPPTSTYKSRFSETSSDTASSPHSFTRQTGTLGTSSGGGGGGGGTADGQIISFTSNDYDSYEDEVAVDVVNLLPASAWTEVEAALGQFKTMSVPNAVSSDKGGLLRSVLLPFLALEAETVSFEVIGSSHFNSGKTRRALFFEWIQHLLLELQTVQTSADRGAILESIACIIESRNFSASMFQSDEDDENKFYSVFGHILSYAIGELNKKGVYQNTLIFSGRLLAVAFFRIDGVASKLLRALPVNRFALERVAGEVDWESNMSGDWEAYRRRFPPSLHDFCFQDARSYLKMLDSQTAAQPGDEQNDDDRFLVRQPSVEVEMSGNWLRRWQSDDSELFFSFCRSYHRQLSALLSAHRGSASAGNSFFGGPGYAHLATCIHQKCLSLVHRDILSVTTLSSQKNFNPGETANVLSGSTAGKPRHLEAANRRCTAIVVDIIRAPSTSNQQTFGPMLGIHIKCLIKRTSLYDVQGVFCLLDWLDGVLNHMESAELPIDGLVDVEFLIQTIWLLLKDADHALALMRTIAFCYSNFAILTSSSKNRIRFCEEILLHPRIFQKLFLSWSFTIRAYFLHLLVFRLARINDFPQPEKDTRGKTAISVARLFNQRLDEIRKRHDELSPTASSADSVSEEEEDQTKTNTKARAQSFVSTIKHTSPPSTNSESPGSLTKAERLLGIGQLDPALSIKGETKVQSRAAKWLRALSAKGTGKGSKRIEASLLGSPYLGASPISEGKPFPASEGAEGETPKTLAEMTNEADAQQEKGDRGEDGLGLTGADEKAVGTPTSEGVFEFSFEARNSAQDGQGGEARFDDDDNAEEEKSANEHISRKLSFDLQSPTSALPPPSAQSSSTTNGEDVRGASGKLSVSGSQSRVSKAFNRRQSLLPGPAFNLVNHQGGSDDEDGGDAAIGAVNEEQRSQSDKKRAKSQEMLVAEPYSQTLHIYAVQSLREYEQTVLEHDEFFAKQADADNPQVPRLPIQWPAMWSE